MSKNIKKNIKKIKWWHVVIGVVVLLILISVFTKPTIDVDDLKLCLEGKYRAPGDLQRAMRETYGTKISYIEIWREEMMSSKFCNIRTVYSDYIELGGQKKYSSNAKFGLPYLDFTIEELENNRNNFAYVFMNRFHHP